MSADEPESGGILRRLSLTTTQGRDLKEMKKKFTGSVSMSGEDLSLYSLDLDGLLSKVEKSRNITLVA